VCYLMLVSCSALNIGLCVSVFVSLICRLCLLILLVHMWYFSDVFRHFLSCVLIMSKVPVMLPYLCPVFNMWIEYSKGLSLFLISCTCSLYMVQNALPIKGLEFEQAVKAFHLVDATFIVFVCSWVSFHYTLYSVLHFECCIYLGVIE
jgi:hypothetical protein